MNTVDISRLSDSELLTRAERLAAGTRESASDLIETLAIIDDRRLYFECDCRSMHEYCVFKLRLSDSSAYRHIRAARAIRIFPPVGALLRSGKLSLETIVVIHPYLEDEDAHLLVTAAIGKRAYEVERLVASRRTEAPRRDVIRLIASRTAAETPSTAASAPAVGSIPGPALPVYSKSPQPSLPSFPAEESVSEPPGRAYESRQELYASVPPASKTEPSARARHDVRIAFTADESFAQLLEEVQAAMRHKYPDGRLEGIFRDALKALLRKNRPWAIPKFPKAER
ncbi:MAG: hypothetical protein HY923_06165 [Elusimicrobia bacterium]|nr:hypothetical protein [Elusimicrobiota bacterium]